MEPLWTRVYDSFEVGFNGAGEGHVAGFAQHDRRWLPVHPKGRCARELFSCIFSFFSPIQKRLALSKTGITIMWRIFQWFLFCSISTVAVLTLFSNLWMIFHLVGKTDQKLTEMLDHKCHLMNLTKMNKNLLTEIE